MNQDWDEVEALRASLREHMAEIKRLNECLTWEQHRAEHVGTHGPGCAMWGPKHYECLLRAHKALKERTVREDRTVWATSQESRQVEPVAWAVITKGGKLYKAASTKESAERKAQQQIDKLGAEWECSVVPLYTAPPTREPLTDKEISDLFNAQIFHLTDVHSVIDFVRDIERAHGIGGEK